jgi:hypothetical protein
MITVYRLFQIIMGIILSAFILYLLIDYAGKYAGVGEEAERLKTLSVFLQDAENVYFSGNPIRFTEFSRDDYTSCYPRPTTPPTLRCFIEEQNYETRQLLIPVFTRLGDDVLISRSSLDYGWTRQDYIEALTGMTVVFNPMVEHDDDASWNLIGEIVATFPDTSGYQPKVFFDLCDGSSLLIEESKGVPYERREFLNIIGSYRDTLDRCTASLPYNHVLVTLSQSCSPGFADTGICLTPPQDGAGHAYISGSSKVYVYKDPADIAALIAGSGREDVAGTPLGEETWEFKNQFFLDSLGTAARFMERRCSILSSSESRQECRSKYLELQGSMAGIMLLAEGDYHDIDDMRDLRAGLDQARGIWDELIDMGCESHA